MKAKYPDVFICLDAAEKAMSEANKFYQIGKEKTGSPWEAAMYPLAQLVLREGIHKSPLDIVELDEIERIVVTHVFYPLDIHKKYSSGKATFYKGLGANEYMNRLLGEFIARYPLLDSFCKQHSHPFQGKVYLSYGDLTHSIFNSYNWFRSKGLNTMFSFVMTPMLKLEGWYFSCFGLKADGRHVELMVDFVSRGHSYVQAARSQPYYSTVDGGQWCDETKSQLIAAGLKVSRNVLRRGWRRYTVDLSGNKYVICLPPFFPNQTAKVYKVVNDLQNPFQLINLPASVWSETGKPYQQYNILHLIEFIKKSERSLK